VPVAERRSKFWLRIVLSCAGVLGISLLFIPLEMWMRTQSRLVFLTVDSAWYLVMAVLTLLPAAIGFKIRPVVLGWCLVIAFALQHFSFALINEVLFMGIFPAGSVPFVVYAFVCAGATAVLFYGVYRWFKGYLSYLVRSHVASGTRYVLFYAGIFFVIYVAAYLNQLDVQVDLTGGGRRFFWMPVLVDMMNSVLVVLIWFLRLRMYRFNMEKDLATHLTERMSRQFEAFRESVGYINEKVHDLKYQLRALQTGEKSLSESAVKEIEDKIAIYESFTETGCHTLDIILMDKYFLCKSKGIAISYIADAEALCRLESSDIFILFGNLIDNAVEYVEKLDDPEKKFIRMSVKPVSGMRMITVENYFEGKLSFTNGLPATTKPDKHWHGFGLSSVRRVAEKYGGRLEVSAANGLFAANVMLPDGNE
jgi:signal transduction histidine kinase